MTAIVNESIVNPKDILFILPPDYKQEALLFGILKFNEQCQVQSFYIHIKQYKYYFGIWDEHFQTTDTFVENIAKTIGSCRWFESPFPI